MGISVPTPDNAHSPPHRAAAPNVPKPFSYAASRVADAVIVAVSGEVDMATAQELEHAIGSVQGPMRRVIVDLSGVSFVDSTALNSLRNCQRRFDAEQIAFGLVIPPERRDIRKVFEITQLIEPLGVVESLDEALARSHSGAGEIGMTLHEVACEPE